MNTLDEIDHADYQPENKISVIDEIILKYQQSLDKAEVEILINFI